MTTIGGKNGNFRLYNLNYISTDTNEVQLFWLTHAFGALN